MKHFSNLALIYLIYWLQALDEANFHYPIQKKFGYLIRFRFVCDGEIENRKPGSQEKDKLQGTVPSIQVSSTPEIAPDNLVLPSSPASKEIEEVTAPSDGW